VIARVGPRTPFGSPRTLQVAARRGAWVGVTDSTLPNNRLAWVADRTSALVTRRTRISLRVSLAGRKLELVDGSHVEKQIPVGIGAPGSPTPAGRFAVTDKLPGGRYSASYGCCILALSGHQPNVPAGWQGGNRLAIHGGSVGTRSSSGCLHAPERDLRLLMRKVPLGTPVVIRKR
jgi:lipoprotein-anchoring transpeptidase ErfK/SrfK